MHGLMHVRVKLSAKKPVGQPGGRTHFFVDLLPNNAKGERLQLMLHFLLSW